MPNPDCPQIHQQYKNLLNLKEKFEQTSDLAGKEKLMKELKLNLEELEARVNLRYAVKIDYSRPLDEMIKAGKYDHVSDDITNEHFPQEKSRETKLSFELFKVSEETTTENITQQMKDRGLRPATLQELLAFGEKYPDKQREFPILVLGSVWLYPDGDHRVPCLGVVGGLERELGLRRYKYHWGNWQYRFLAVRK